MSHRRGRTLVLPAAVAGVAVVLAACSGGGEGDDGGTADGGGEAGGTITVWTMESLPDRFQATQEIAAAFTEETGVKVDLVGIEDAQAPQLIQSNALSGDLPDVMASFPLALVHQMASLDMVDTETTQAVLDTLGEDTFDPAALELTRQGEDQLSIPSDGWSQILVYRKDLFEAAGLEPPTTYAALEEAAQALTTGGQFGITIATDASDVFTQQSFEALALGNGCQLVDDTPEVTLADDACQETFRLYDALGSDLSPAGTQTVDSTRAAYFAGQAAMVMWSTYILDEMAGLRNDALPTCPECAADPAWLAQNSGVVTTIEGPDGEDAGSYGEIANWVAINGDNPEGAQAFIEYMMSTGYTDWLAMAPEGKFPMRTGDQDNPSAFTDAWADLDAGVDTRAPLSDFYDEQTLDILTSVGETIDRWALPQGQGPLLGSFTAELPLAGAISDMTAGSLSPDQAAEQAADAATEMLQRQQ
ncbi:extracellular solute-binding protein [Georgenia sp. TF02-10]|uniref:extracellular solute-binding protein n=1 Tax=Georgenia sp. TF02-10 TaxID=2917725 RepID=UPI001FA6C671|nr:extracellular solute-binding protein [Georgenia sp. TF02-10]UNX55684.1 extracellular solute-binding protein [Georgenia sp. TF02-10]